MVPVSPAVHDRRGGGQGRQDRQQQPDGGMQAAEFVVPAKADIEVDALQIGPAMALAGENAVVGLIDGAVAVGPQLGLPGRVHPGMHGARQQPAAERGQAAR